MGYAFGINGFGRIGRLVARIMIDDPNSSLLAINTGADANYMAYQFKYDTIHGRWKGSLEVVIRLIPIFATMKLNCFSERLMATTWLSMVSV